MAEHCYSRVFHQKADCPTSTISHVETFEARVWPLLMIFGRWVWSLCHRCLGYSYSRSNLALHQVANHLIQRSYNFLLVHPAGISVILLFGWEITRRVHWTLTQLSPKDNTDLCNPLVFVVYMDNDAWILRVCDRHLVERLRYGIDERHLRETCLLKMFIILKIHYSRSSWDPLLTKVLVMNPWGQIHQKKWMNLLHWCCNSLFNLTPLLRLLYFTWGRALLPLNRLLIIIWFE